MACFIILTYKRRSSKFHNLLKLLSLFDIIVILGCSFLYGLPGVRWDLFELVIYPRCLPVILPLTQMSLMASVYCTILMSFERYVRICHLCQLRYNSWLSEKTFGFLIAFVTMFPICFYMPRFFEMRSKEDIKVVNLLLDCSNYTDELRIMQLNETMTDISRGQTDPILEACARVDYGILATHGMLYITQKKVELIELEATWLGKNTAYQLTRDILNTTFATAIPVILLFYLNMSTVIALAKMKKMQRTENSIGLTLQPLVHQNTTSNCGPNFTTMTAITTTSSETTSRRPNDKTVAFETEEILEESQGDDPAPTGPIVPGKLSDPKRSETNLNQIGNGSEEGDEGRGKRRWRFLLPRKVSITVRISSPQQQSVHATENRLTRISLAIVWMFIFCHIWKLIPTVYDAITAEEDHDNWPQWLHRINDISHTLIVFNSAVNFLIYSIL